MVHGIWLTSDLTSLFIASQAADLLPVDRALRVVWPAYCDDAVVRHCGDRIDECPHLLAEWVELAVQALTADLVGFGDVQADLAAAALVCVARPLPDTATIPELEAEVLAHVPGSSRRNSLADLAVAVARLRRSKLRRAARFRLPIEAKRLTRVSAVGSGGDFVRDIFDKVWEGIGSLPFFSDFEARAEEARQKLERVNILVAGRTGVGKSTLINAVFGSRVASVGMGRPVTQNITWFEPPGLPIRLCDTKGLELVDFAATLAALSSEIDRCNASGKVEDRIHILWLCIDEPGTRVQDGEERVAELCAKHRIPAIVVLTKAIGPRTFEAAVRERLPTARHIVRVLVEEWGDRRPFGLPDLVRATEEVLLEATKAAFDTSQQVDIARKRARALKVAAGAATTAAAAAAVPIPVIDAAGVFGVNVGMVTGIAAAMGVPMTRDNLLTLSASMVGALAVAAGGRMIAGEVLKLIPGIGSVVGGFITAGIAGSATYGLGYGFIEFLCRYHAVSGRMPEGEELRQGFRKFWETWKDKEKALPA